MKAKIIGIIKSVKHHIDFEFRNKQIHEDAFYEVQSKLDIILEDYTTLSTFFEMGNSKYMHHVKKYKQNIQKIRDLIRIYGCNFETIFIVENINFNSNADLEVIEMLKNSFYSTSYKIMDLNETQPEAEVAAIESLSSSPDIFTYFSRINSSSKELINQCYATRVYLKIVDNKILCIDGIFANWANHLSAVLSKHFREKFLKIKQRIENMLTIKQQYKNNWLEQLNLREICCITVDDIDKELLELTKLHREYKNKKTNILVNSFINAEKIEKRKVILSLLLSPNDSEIFYLGRLFLHFLPNKIVREIQMSFHPYIQQKIYKSSITLFDNIVPAAIVAAESEDDYENRILMMNTSER